MTELQTVRAVLDTNVVVAAFLTKRPTSPTREIIERWRRREYALLYSDDLLLEIAEKLLERRIPATAVADFLRDLRAGAVRVEVAASDISEAIPADPDDDRVLACAVLGQATHLVTYDPHFSVLGEKYRGIRIVDASTFLRSLRQRGAQAS